MSKKVLVCGSRNWTRCWMIETYLDGLDARFGPLIIIEGEAAGADRAGAVWAERHDPRREVMRFPADWERHGKRAGFLRNTAMLEEGQPDLVLAFADDLSTSVGTAMMVKIARAAGVPTIVVSGGGR